MEARETSSADRSKMSLYDGAIGEEVINRLQLATLIEEESLCYDQSLRGLTGLRNLGNTCYMNSALQALSNCPPLREYFRSFLTSSNGYMDANDSYQGGHNTRPVSNAFRDLMTRIWSDKQPSYVAPTLMLVKVREKCPQFRGFAQQDAQEFIRCFLDVLHQELRRPVKKWEVDFMHDWNISVLPSSSAEPSSGGSSRSSHHSAEDNEIFETADSGLSSDTDDVLKANVDYAGDSAAKAGESAREKVVGYKSVITEVFDGELVSSVKCQTCQHISYTKENFQDISLSIPTMEQLEYMRDLSPSSSIESPSRTKTNSSTYVMDYDYGYLYWFYTLASRWFLNPWYNWFASFYRYVFTGSISLENCLKAFFSMDFLHGDDMYSCEKCSKLRNGVKQCELIKLPEILCIHLKRFRHDNMYNAKINTKVTFPLCDLDMRPYIRDSVLEKDEGITTDYDLVAIVSHRGGSVDFGHYIAYCRNEFDKNWYEFDDSIVTRVNALEIMSKEVYVLFYQKKTSDAMDEIKSRCQSLLQHSLKGNAFDNVNLDRYYISKEWFHKFLTFSEPGPINNCDFLCSHGQMTPTYSAAENSRSGVSVCVFVAEGMWSFLQRRMGGGPACRQLVECAQCKRSFDSVIKRKHFEHNMYNKLESDSAYTECFPQNVISTHWMEKWKAFVTDVDTEPPPPINNEALVRKYKDGSSRLRIGAKYMKLNRETWVFLHGVYGGGPELLAVPFSQPTTEEIIRLLERIDHERQRVLAKQLTDEPDTEADNTEMEGTKTLPDISEGSDSEVDDHRPLAKRRRSERTDVNDVQQKSASDVETNSSDEKCPQTFLTKDTKANNEEIDSCNGGESRNGRQHQCSVAAGDNEEEFTVEMDDSASALTGNEGDEV